MDEIILSNNSEMTKKGTEKKSKEAKWVVVLREIIGAIFWLFSLTKLLVFDVDIFIINSINPFWISILDYKVFILLGSISLCWLLLGNAKFFRLVFTIVFFPFIFILWRIPKIFWKSKSWAGVFASIGVLFTFISSIKSNFIIFTLFCLSVIVIIKSSSPLLLIIAIIFLFLYLIFHFARKFRYAFKPSRIFSLQVEVVNNYWGNIKDYFVLAEDIKAEDYNNMDSTQKEKWSSTLQFLLILNRIFLFISNKLKKFQKSRLNIVYYFSSIFFTFILTGITFSLLNNALFKLDSKAFNSAPKGNFFFFVYYSFNTMFTNSINDFYPISNTARIFNLSEILFAFLLLTILFFLFTSIIRDKHNEEISYVIETMSNKGVELEKLIDKEYQMDLSQAIDSIEKIQGNMIQIIYYFTKNID